MTLRHIRLSVTALLAALSLAFVSCNKSEVHLGLANETVENSAGKQILKMSVSGHWTLDILYLGDESGWASVDMTEGDGPHSNIYLRYQANEGADRSLRITLNAAGGSSSVTMVQLGVSAPISFEQGSDVAEPRWLELPATEADDGRAFFYRTMTVNNRTVRNYSFDYRYADLVSQWVAYPLNTNLIGTYYGRADQQTELPSWGYDPLVPQDFQQYVLSGYGTGLTRGHQIPSADRQGNYERNVSTFYATNMTPQKYDFNCQIWANLEGAVRSLAKMSDTLYVVTGCVVGSATTTDRNRNKIALPVAYFKVMLYYGKNSTYAKYSGYSAIAAYLPHDNSIAGESFTKYFLTVNELEKQLAEDGNPLTFFVNLPSEIAAKVKAQDTSWLPASIK